MVRRKTDEGIDLDTASLDFKYKINYFKDIFKKNGVNKILFYFDGLYYTC